MCLRFHRPSSLMHHHGRAWQAAAPHPTRSGVEARAEDGHSPQALTNERLPTKPLAEGEQLTCDHVKGSTARLGLPRRGHQAQQEAGRELAVLAWQAPPTSKLPRISRKEESKPPSHLGLRGHK